MMQVTPGAEAPTPADYLRAAECREQLQRAYATWLASGGRGYGSAFERLQWAAGAHMRAAMRAQV